MKRISNVLLWLVMVSGSSAVFAENDQTVVIGYGSGLHTFSTTDDLRQNGFFIDSMAGASDLYVEWYAFEEFGVGFRLNGLGVVETVSTLSTIEQRELSVGSSFITLNWVPVGASDYTRFGLLAGFGNSEYKYTELKDYATVNSVSTEGPATLLGGYVDWGGEDFGARFSLNLLNTDLAEKNGTKVDASGSYWTFDLRWAFR